MRGSEGTIHNPEIGQLVSHKSEGLLIPRKYPLFQGLIKKMSINFRVGTVNPQPSRTAKRGGKMALLRRGHCYSDFWTFYIGFVLIIWLLFISYCFRSTTFEVCYQKQSLFHVQMHKQELTTQEDKMRTDLVKMQEMRSNSGQGHVLLSPLLHI